jgi:D-glycero-beta-D-manno-heptose 1-phosphate adenylyltransferase
MWHSLKSERYPTMNSKVKSLARWLRILFSWNEQPVCKHKAEATTTFEQDASQRLSVHCCTLKKSNMQKLSQEKYLDPQCIETHIDMLRAEGNRITTINGTFDILHAGHLEILYQASLQGDVLIVALNTDDSVRKYKGPHRPIIPFVYRQKLIAALEMVDYVTWFDALDPRDLLSKIRPDVHVNGAEYGNHCIEADVVKAHGGKIHLVERIDGLSTSKIIRTCASLVN